MKALPVVLAVITLGVAATEFYRTHLAENEIVSLPTSRISDPEGQEKGIVVLLSDAAGWGAREERMSKALTGEGAVVVGVDLPQYYAALGREDRECLYLVSDIEELSRQIHRDRDMATYRPPLVAGIGGGGSLALAIAAQTPFSTIGATLAVDPVASIPLSKILCTPAPKQLAAGGIAYGLTEGALPNAVDVVFTPTGDPAGRSHVDDLRRSHPGIEVIAGTEPPETAFLSATRNVLTAAATSVSPLDLPIVPIEATPTRNTMAVIYSGDGGWRDIDQKLAGHLEEEGIPVVGVDSLRYFWNAKTPDEAAADLSRIIGTYSRRWNVQNVVLIGYSFGANILPATYRRLPENDRNAVRLVSLLALSRQADFEIAVTGWLGYAGMGRHGDPVDDLAQMEPAKIQCIHGVEEKDSACPALEGIAGADIHARPGGHHFDGDYQTLTRLIVDRLDRLERLSPMM
jgi:type IV secretory pathway VirJ component